MLRSIEYLAECRWPDRFQCPQCGGEKAWALPVRRLRECAACGHQPSTTAGTIPHGTRTPLRVWFWAAYLMITDTRGISARGLQKRLGLASRPRVANVPIESSQAAP